MKSKKSPTNSNRWRTLTLKMPENVHKKLRILAAMREQNLTETIVELIRKEKIDDPKEIAAMQDIIYGMTSAPDVRKPEHMDGEQIKGPSAETSEILKKRKENAPVKIENESET